MTKASNIGQKADCLFFTTEIDGAEARIQLSFIDDDSVQVSVYRESVAPLSSFMSMWTFEPGEPDFSFAPHIRPADDYVLNQWGMKTPAAILQKDDIAAAIVLDPSSVGAETRRVPVALGIDADPLSREKPVFGLGYRRTKPSELNYFRAIDEPIDPQGKLNFTYYLWIKDGLEPCMGYREVAQKLWMMFGHNRLHSSLSPQTAPFERFAEVGLEYAMRDLWQEHTLSDGRLVGGMANGIVYDNDVWFESLFNHLRSAIGLRGFGHERESDLVRELALSAPQISEGPFSTIFTPAVRQARVEHNWVSSSHWMLSTGVEGKMRSVRKQNLVKSVDWEHLYHTVDCSWHVYWMLRWYCDIDKDERMVEYARKWADFLLDIQAESGAIPSFIRMSDLRAEPLLAANVGSAASGAVLAQLGRITGNHRYLDAALRIARFIVHDVVRPRVWQDYEVVFDSGAKPLGFYDRHTHQYAQTTQGMVWTIALFHELFKATEEKSWLEIAGEVVDYLSLFQQLWDPPFLSVRTFGGFPVGNSHPSWNDARTPLLATPFDDHFVLTGDPQYLERAVAAYRASFVLMFTPENESVSAISAAGPVGHADEGYAGRGIDEQFTGLSFDFPVGAALSSIAIAQVRHGDVRVDAKSGHSLGINGWIVSSEVSDGAVKLSLTGLGAENATVVIHGLEKDTELIVNGISKGTFDVTSFLSGVIVDV